MKKTELESKHIAELHALAAQAGVPKYRMLRREELIEQLAGGEPAKAERPSGGDRPSGEERPARRERPQRQRRERGGRERPPRERRERPPREKAPERDEPAPKEREPAPKEREPTPEEREQAPAAAQSDPKRKRRRRRFGRRSKGLSAKDLITPPPGRQALVYGDSRAACTALLRELAGELADGSIALLIDPSPEELADWKREAPQAELVVAAQARHASDALAQAVRRAEGGEDVTLLVDSLSRLEDADAAKEIYDGGLGLSGSGSLTVVAALERSA